LFEINSSAHCLSQSKLGKCRHMSTMETEPIADKLREMADLLEIQREDGFRVAALSFRTDTLELAKMAKVGPSWAIRGVTKALPLGGGLPIRAGDGSLVGAVGVSGTPGGDADASCAKAGIAAVEDRIAF